MINHEYLELFNESSVRKDIDIVYDTDQHISNSDVVSGTFGLNESAFATKELRFGSLVASELSVKLYNTVPNLMDKDISVSITLDNMASNPLKIGKYKVLEDKPTTDRLYKQIKAYDGLYEVINKEVVSWYEGLLFPMTLKVFRDSFFVFLGIEQENTTLINDDMLVDKTILANSIPGKQVLSAICELNGAIGRMNRDGKFEYVILDANPSSRITIDNIASKSGSYEDFDCQPISKVQIRQTTDDIGAIVGTDGNTYIVQNNFLVYGKSATDLNSIASKLLSVVKGVTYTPFNVKAIYGNPCYEIGDAITVVAANKTFNSYMFNRTLKGIQAMTDNIKADGVEYYTENLNSANTQIQQLARQTNELSRTVEETKSTITKIEGNTSLSNTAVGNSITTTDSGEYPLIELYGYGRSEQKSYKGINLIDLSEPSSIYRISNYSFNVETGLVTFDYDGNHTRAEFVCNYLVGETVYAYIKNWENSNSSGINTVQIVYTASDGTTKYLIFGDKSSHTIPSDATNIRLQIYGNNSSASVSGTLSVNIMISSEPTETYEQYVGGEASPNPSYPQDIESVADIGKNQIENSAISQTINGVKFTVKPDGSVVVNGTAESEAVLKISKQILPVGKYIASGGYDENCDFQCLITNGGAIAYTAGQGNPFDVEVTDTTTLLTFSVCVPSGATVDNKTVYPMVRKADIADDTYEPPFNFIRVNTNSKNLLEYTYGHYINPFTTNGITFTRNDDSSVTVSGTATATAYYNYDMINSNLEIGQTYILSLAEEDVGVGMNFGTHKGNPSAWEDIVNTKTKRNFVMPNSYIINRVYLSVAKGTTVNATVYPMIRLASIDDDSYVPYKSTQATIILNDSLRGIKVSEGGNFTDETGQQWVCDTLEKYADGSGKLVQRVYSETITADNIWKVENNASAGSNCVATMSNLITTLPSESVVMCDKAIGVPSDNRTTDVEAYRTYSFGAGTKYIYLRYPASVGEITLEQAKADFADAEVAYILETPIETPLTAEQIAEIEKLQTFNPITHVTTDDIGDIAIEYYRNTANADIIAQNNQYVLSKAESSISQTADEIKLEVSKTYSTKSELETSIQGLQDQIDGALGSYSGSEVPTLNNYPANEWTTTAMKDAAIGSLYFVNSEGGEYAGFSYRWEKLSNGTYQWALLKDTEVTQALKELEDLKNNLANNYSTTVQMNSAIKTSADNITTSVSKTYSTKTETSKAQSTANTANSTANSALSKANTNATNISNLTTRVTNAESSITQNAEAIELKVSKGDVSSQLSVESEQVTISGNRLVVDADNFTLEADGSMECSKANITGGSFNVTTDNNKEVKVGISYSDKYKTQLSPSSVHIEVPRYNGTVDFVTDLSAGVYSPIGEYALMTNDGTNMMVLGQDTLAYGTKGSTSIISHYSRNGCKVSGELQSTSANGLRIVSGNYGFFIRNDGSQTYFLLTALGDQYGTYNSLRPLSINDSTGLVTLGNGLSTTSISASGTISANYLKAGPTNGTAIRLIRCGSSVLTPGSSTSTGVKLLAHSTVNGWYSGANASNTAILVTNGDGAANGVHIEGVTYNNSDASWYVVCDTTPGKAFRVNYVVICW